VLEKTLKCISDRRNKKETKLKGNLLESGQLEDKRGNIKGELKEISCSDADWV
jgi:hypothetical protein